MAQDAPPETLARRPPLAGVGHLHPFGRSLADPEGRDPTPPPKSVVARCGNPAPLAAARSALDLRVALRPTPRPTSRPPMGLLAPAAFDATRVADAGSPSLTSSLSIQSPARGAARPAGQSIPPDLGLPDFKKPVAATDSASNTMTPAPGFRSWPPATNPALEIPLSTPR